MTVVDVEEIVRLKTRLAEINDIPFNEIEFHEKGVPITTEQEIKDDFKFMGLINSEFIWMGMYLETVEDHRRESAKWQKEYEESEAKKKAIEAAKPPALSRYTILDMKRLIDAGHLKVVLDGLIETIGEYAATNPEILEETIERLEATSGI